MSVVVPVYNGAGTIGELVGALRSLDIEGGLEMVLVVDCSPDNSLDVCKQLAAEPGAPVTVLSLSRNFGEHNAVMAGLARARGSFTITMDESGCSSTRGTATTTPSTPTMPRRSTRPGATSAAGSPTGAPTS